MSRLPGTRWPAFVRGAVCLACVAIAGIAAAQGVPDRGRPAVQSQRPAARTALPKQRPGENPAIMIDRANGFIMQGRCEEAIPILERLAAQYPQIAAANDMLADCYVKAARPRDAAAVLERCLETEPANLGCAQKLGRVYAQMGERAKAVAVWRRLLPADVTSPAMYSTVAKMEQEAGLYDEAIATLREGTRFKENAEYFDREIIRLERIVGRDDDAFRDALRVVGRRQGALESEIRIVTDIFGESRRPDRLIAMADSAAAAAGDRGGALRALKAVILVEAGRYEDARKHLFGKGAARPGEEESYSLLIHMGRMADRRGDPRFADLEAEIMRDFADRFGSSAHAPAVMLMIASAKREAAAGAGPAREKLLDEALALADAAKRHRLGGPYIDEACIFRARILFEDRGRIDEALRELGPVGPARPAHRMEAEDLRARIFLGSLDWNRATVGLTAMAADPDTAVAAIGRYSLGRLAFLSGRDDEAVKRLSELAEKTPGSVWANDALELAMDVKGGLEEGGGALALYRAAAVAESRGSLDAAIDSLAGIARRFPSSTLAPRALFMKAGLEGDPRGRGGAAPDTAAARADYVKLAETFPLHDLAPRALEKLGALDERVSASAALARYGSIMERYPDYPFMERVRERYVALGKSPGPGGPAPREDGGSAPRDGGGSAPRERGSK